MSIAFVPWWLRRHTDVAGLHVSASFLLNGDRCQNSVGDGTYSAPGNIHSERERARHQGFWALRKLQLPILASESGDLAKGLRDGSTASLHNEDGDSNTGMSVPLRQQLCVSAGESRPAHPAFDFLLCNIVCAFCEEALAS